MSAPVLTERATGVGQDETAVPDPGSPKAPAPQRRGGVLSARSAAVLSVVVVLLMTLALPAKAYITQRARIAQLESQVAWHNQRIEELSLAHERWKDPAYIEAQARARLHYVRVGQVGYVVLADQGSQEAEVTTTRPAAQLPNGGPWWSILWGSVADTAQPKSKKAAPQAPEPASPAPTYAR